MARDRHLKRGERDATARRPFPVARVAWALAALEFVSVTLTISGVGLTWDEPFYYRAGLFTFHWWLTLPFQLARHLTRSGIASAWDLNPEHPPFAKLVFGATFYLFHAWLPVADPLTAFRLGGALFGALAVGAAFAFAAEGISPRAGFLAAAFVAFSPRLFFHFHLAALDGAAAAMCVAAAYAWWRAQQRPTTTRTVVAGVVLGLAVATKSVAFVLPVALLAWAILAKRAFRRETWIPFFIAPVVFFVQWPGLWLDPVNNFIAFLRFQSAHDVNAPSYYFGAIEYPPPWHYPFVLTILVVPLPLAIFGIGGFVRGAKEAFARRALVTPLWMFAAGAFLVAAALGPRYDGERLFEPAFPFFALLAASGLDATLVRWLAPQKKRAFASFAPSPTTRVTLAAVAVALLLAPCAVATWNTRADGEVYYNELAGGTASAADHGFTTEYWSAGMTGLVDWMNANVPRNGSVYIADEGFGAQLFAPLRGNAFPDFVLARDPALTAKAAFTPRLRPDIAIGVPTLAESGVPVVGSDPCAEDPPTTQCLPLLYPGPWEIGPRPGTNLVLVCFDQGDFTPFDAHVIDTGKLRAEVRVDGARVAAIYEVTLSAQNPKGP
ncbi:MAG: ArnT family glycosyltransferase [Thermoplasmatota archaeon]